MSKKTAKMQWTPEKVEDAQGVVSIVRNTLYASGGKTASGTWGGNYPYEVVYRENGTVYGKTTNYSGGTVYFETYPETKRVLGKDKLTGKLALDTYEKCPAERTHDLKVPSQDGQKQSKFWETHVVLEEDGSLDHLTPEQANKNGFSMNHFYSHDENTGMTSSPYEKTVGLIDRGLNSVFHSTSESDDQQSSTEENEA